MGGYAYNPFMSLQQITANLAGSVRRGKHHDREHVIVPVTLIVPGVLNGSQGPLLYPEDEVGKNYTAWNGMPVVLDHPQVNGAPVSAREPGILERVQIGQLFATHANGALKAEAWIDVERAAKLDGRLLSALEEGRAIEVSTGVYVDSEPAPPGSEHDGKPYLGIARNYRPDHLAVLLDTAGACSVADGCGLNVNKSGEVMSLWSRLGQLLGLYSPTTNTAKKEAEVAKTDGNSPTDNKRKPTMNEEERKKLIDYIVANCGSCTEEDRAALQEMGEGQLKSWHDSLKSAADATALAANATKEFTDGTGNVHVWDAKKGQWGIKPKQPVVTNQDDKGKGDNRPRLTPEEQEDLAFARQIKQKHRNEAIAKITANKGNKLTEDQLDAMSLDVLEALADSLPQKTTDWSGAAGAVANQGQKDLAPFGLPHDYIEANAN